MVRLDCLWLHERLLRFLMTASDVHEQLLVHQLAEFVPGCLELINDVELTLTILLAIPEVLDLLLQFAVDLGE